VGSEALQEATRTTRDSPEHAAGPLSLAYGASLSRSLLRRVVDAMQRENDAFFDDPTPLYVRYSTVRCAARLFE
jgi:hypothetical protein